MAEPRLIDANALKTEIVNFKLNLRPQNQDYGTGYFSALSVVEGMLACAPTVDAVPVVHGQWKVLECDGGEPGGYAPYIIVECANCGRIVGIEQGQYGWAYGDPFPWKCCPLCEAKMDGGEDNV